MKNLLIVFCMSIILPCLAVTINGGISYTVEDARIEAFSNVNTQINQSEYKENLIDINLKKNLKKNFNFIDRKIFIFYENGKEVSYSVTYKANKNIVYFYNCNGHLEYIDFFVGNKYPTKTISYNVNGQLDSIVLNINSTNQFVFDINKKLIAHWIGENCYNEKGELIGTRSNTHK